MATQFNGWDYSEILIALGVDHKQSDEDIRAQVLFLFPKLGSDELSEEEVERVAVMRQFLAAHIIRGLPHNHSGPLMAGLLAIDDDYTFAVYFARLVTSMWV